MRAQSTWRTDDATATVEYGKECMAAAAAAAAETETETGPLLGFLKRVFLEGAEKRRKRRRGD